MTYRGISDSQANAEALARRGSPYTAASDASFRVKWDFHRREPADLREAVRMARKAYSDEVPDKLHDGLGNLADDGTPRMTAKATGYIFGSAQGSDASRDPETGQPDLVSYYHSPFRATLERFEKGGEGERHRAAIVSHVTIGSQGPVDAAITEGVPAWCAKLVAFDALASFLRSMTDLKLHLSREHEAA